MIPILSTALHAVAAFHQGRLNAIELEQILLDGGWINVKFGSPIRATYLNIEYDLEA